MVLYTSLAWAGWVAYPDRWAMRRPETGMSLSTDSHAFFIIRYSRSGAVYREFNFLHMKRLLLPVVLSIMLTPPVFPIGLEKEINGAYYSIEDIGNDEYEAVLRGISKEVTDFVFQSTVSWETGASAKVVGIVDGCFRGLENLRTITFKESWTDKYDSYFQGEFNGCTSLQKIIGLNYVLRDHQNLNFEGCRSLDTSFDWLPYDIFINELKCSLEYGERVETPLIHINSMIGSAEFSGWCPVKFVVDSFESQDNYYKILNDVGFGWENLAEIEAHRPYKFHNTLISAPELKSIEIDADVTNILGFMDCPRLETIDMVNVDYYQEDCVIERADERELNFVINGVPDLRKCRFPYINYIQTMDLTSTRIPNACKLPDLSVLNGYNVYFESGATFPKSLEKLDLGYSYIGDSITLSLPNVEALRLENLRGIKYLNLWDCPKVEDGCADFNIYDDSEDAGYRSIETIIQPKNCRSVGSYISSFPKLKVFGFGDKVEYLPEIKDCPLLKDIIYGGTLDQWMDMTFPCYHQYLTVSTTELSLPGIERLWYGDGCNMTKYLTDLVVLDSDRTKVSPAAFSGYEGLESVFITCDTIGQGAFRSCPNLRDVVFQGSFIETLALSECRSVRQLTLGEKFKKAIYRAFENAGPYNLFFMGSVDEWAEVEFVNNWSDRGHEHHWSGNLEKSISPTQNTLSFHIGNIPVVQLSVGKVKKVGPGTFSGVKSLKSVEIDGSEPVSLGDYAFSDCPELDSVKIRHQSRSGDSEITIGEKTFFNDVKLRDIDFINRVDEVGTDAFENTAWYDNSPDGLVYIGSTAYRYKGLGAGHVSINSGTRYIAGNCFSGQRDILSIDVPDGMLKIGNEAFYRCDNIRNFVVPESVAELRSIPDKCTDISFKDGVEPLSVDLNVFCDSLRRLYIGREINGPTSGFMGYLPNLHTLTFGKNITKLTSDMVSSDDFAYPVLTTLEVLAPVPPALQYEKHEIWNEETGNYEEVEECVSLKAFDPAKVRLLVPAESVDLYKNTPEWNKFYNIDTSGIDTVLNDGNTTIKARYDLQGRSVNDNFKGVVIEILSDGTVRKRIY